MIFGNKLKNIKIKQLQTNYKNHNTLKEYSKTKNTTKQKQKL